MQGAAGTLSLLAATLVAAGCLGGTGPGAEPVGPSTAAFDQRTGGLEGFVLDETHLPIADARVWLSRSGEATTTTQDGRFSFSYLQPGAVTLTATAPTFETASMSATITAGQVSHVQFFLGQAPIEEPYRTTRVMAGYIMCQLSQSVLGSNPCGPALVDILTGQDSGVERYLLPFEVTGPDFHDMLLEITWQPSFATASPSMTAGVWGPPQPGAGFPTQDLYLQWPSANPLQVWATAGVVNAGGAEVFQPDPNATQVYTLVASGWHENSTLPQTSVFIEHRFDVYLTFFHHRAGPQGWTALPEA